MVNIYLILIKSSNVRGLLSYVLDSISNGFIDKLNFIMSKFILLWIRAK
jgi:hypothetical protein